MSIFLNIWTCKEEVLRNFEIDHIDGEIIIASYGAYSFEGYAFVLFRGNDGKYYEVNGSHCSCYGLEGQWEPEEVNLDELWHRVTVGTFGRETYEGGPFNEELKEVLSSIRCAN